MVDYQCTDDMSHQCWRIRTGWSCCISFVCSNHATRWGVYLPLWSFWLYQGGLVCTVYKGTTEFTTYMNPQKVWPHRDYPLHEVGRIVLNRNPANYFAEVEQVCFANLMHRVWNELCRFQHLLLSFPSVCRLHFHQAVSSLASSLLPTVCCRDVFLLTTMHRCTA